MRSPFEATGINMDSPTSEALKPELLLCVCVCVHAQPSQCALPLRGISALLSGQRRGGVY